MQEEGRNTNPHLRKFALWLNAKEEQKPETCGLHSQSETCESTKCDRGESCGSTRSGHTARGENCGDQPAANKNMPGMATSMAGQEETVLEMRKAIEKLSQQLDKLQEKTMNKAETVDVAVDGQSQGSWQEFASVEATDQK